MSGKLPRVSMAHKLTLECLFKSFRYKCGRNFTLWTTFANVTCSQVTFKCFWFLDVINILQFPRKIISLVATVHIHKCVNPDPEVLDLFRLCLLCLRPQIYINNRLSKNSPVWNVFSFSYWVKSACSLSLEWHWLVTMSSYYKSCVACQYCPLSIQWRFLSE